MLVIKENEAESQCTKVPLRITEVLNTAIHSYDIYIYGEELINEIIIILV